MGSHDTWTRRGSGSVSRRPAYMERAYHNLLLLHDVGKLHPDDVARSLKIEPKRRSCRITSSYGYGQVSLIGTWPPRPAPHSLHGHLPYMGTFLIWAPARRASTLARRCPAPRAPPRRCRRTAPLPRAARPPPPVQVGTPKAPPQTQTPPANPTRAGGEARGYPRGHGITRWQMTRRSLAARCNFIPGASSSPPEHALERASRASAPPPSPRRHAR